MFKQLDLDPIAKALSRWLPARLGSVGELRLENLRTPSAGLSNDTVLFDLSYRNAAGEQRESLVARLAPTEDLVFPDYDIAGQFRLLERLAATELPVARVRWLEEDRSVLGTPFYVMDLVAGEAPSDVPPYHAAGLCADALPEQRAAMWWAGIEVLAQVQRLDWKKLGLGFLGEPASPAEALQMQLDYWTRYFAWARTDEPQPIIDTALAWLSENRPSGGRTALCWGDARLPNILFRDYRVAAVLDWEMAFLGDPEADLAWWLFLDWNHSEGYDIPRLQGLPGRDETIARYEQLAGVKVRNLFWYDVFAALRFAMIMVPAIENMKRREVPLPSADFASNNPCTRRLAELLGLRPPGQGTAMG